MSNAVMAASTGVRALCENPTEVFLDASKLLLTYADNILRNPNEEKYRSIRIGNPTFSTRLLPIRGAVECLFEMGFEEAETHLVFPKTASVERLREIREFIATERDQRLGAVGSSSCPLSSPVVRPPQESNTVTTPQTLPPPQAPSSPQPTFVENRLNIFRTLQSNCQHVMLYETPALQQRARDCIPHAELRGRALRKLEQAKASDPEGCLVEDDLLLLELLQWFKGEFFSWVNSLPCSVCGGKTENKGSLPPSAEDLRWDAQRVENHHCSTCQLTTRFPRYNNPEKLLETRRGRCGEWANCFTLCCRAVGLDARYIWDITDHVWTEVYSHSQRRWLHCDPCENVCDKPLLYEMGWGKKLSYVFAFSREQVVDVTWRYSCRHQEVLSRRTQVQEGWLLHTLNALNVVKQHNMSAERKQELLERLLVELVEFISPKTPKAGELGGRTSGSLGWRIARGETGALPANTEGCIFHPTEAEKQSKQFHLIYNVTKDRYCRLSSEREELHGWQRGVWRSDSIFRKEETDWQMVYLARVEGSSCGKISWKFDCGDSGVKIKTVSVRAVSQTFHSGQIRWRMRSESDSQEFSAGGEMQSKSSFCGCTQLVVEAELSGGEGESSWQHSQLFRHGMKEAEESSFEVLVEMMEA